MSRSVSTHSLYSRQEPVQSIRKSKMRPTVRLWQQTLRLTLFTRENCSLCVTAKSVLSNVWDKRAFTFEEVDVMQSKHQKWKDVYEFDTPVVHVDRNVPDQSTSIQSCKLMHRFSEADVEKTMDQVQGKHV
nr:glutaredoxin-like protein [Quercus suber]